MRVLVVRNNYNPKALEASYLLEAFFEKQHIYYETYDCDTLRTTCVVPQNSTAQTTTLQGASRYAGAGYNSAAQTDTAQTDTTPTDTAQQPPFNLAVVLGGDGTILCTANQIGTMRIPILGINFGHLGFMANPNDDGVIAIVSAALAGDVICEARTNLNIEVYCEDEQQPQNSKTYKSANNLENPSNGKTAEGQCAEATNTILKDATQTPKRFFALNEMVIARGDLGRIINFKYRISNSAMADMRGDGLIVASATGSTGYALSAGGPLIDPSYKGLVAVPIAPHTLQSRAVVTGNSDVIEIDLDTSSASRMATLFIDGERIELDSPIRKVVVATGIEPTLLLRYKSTSFYEYAASTFFKN